MVDVVRSIDAVLLRCHRRYLLAAFISSYSALVGIKVDKDVISTCHSMS